MFSLDNHSVVPLYRQLKEHILEQIQTGALKEGDKLPTEQEYSDRLGVSRITVRRAFNELTEEGLLIRGTGKGTFVKSSKIGENILDNLSFTSVCLKNGVKPGAKVCQISLQTPSKEDEEQLGETERVLYLERVRTMDGLPVILEQNWFPSEYAGLIQEKLEDVSLYSVLAERFGLGNLHNRKTIEIAFADERESRLLHIPENTPVLQVKELVFDSAQTPVHRTRQLILGDKFKYEISSP